MVKGGCERIQSLFSKLTSVTSRDLLSEIYPYLWDIKEIANMLSNIIRGFEAGKPPQKRGVPSNVRPSVSHGGIVTLLQVCRRRVEVVVALEGWKAKNGQNDGWEGRALATVRAVSAVFPPSRHR